MAIPLLTVLVAATLLAGVTSNTFCTQETPVAGEMARPKLTSSYMAQISMKDFASKSMAFIYESFDAKKQMLALNYWMEGTEETQIYNLKEKTIRSFGGRGDCYTGDSSVISNYTTAVDLMMRFGDVWKYKGTTFIRGLNVTRWTSCVSEFGGMVNQTADFYYLTKDMSPFRIDVRDVQQFAHDYVPHKNHVVFDYYMYEKKQPYAVYFKPTPGIVCSDTHVAQPPLPTSATFREEIVDPVKKSVSYTRINFDKELNVSSEATLDGRTVTDYLRGIRFNFTNNGTCTREAFYNTASSELSEDAKKHIHMASLSHFFLDTGNFTSNGAYKVRGVLCDVYTKVGTSADSLGNAVVEIYIAKAGLAEYTPESAWASGASGRAVMRIILRAGNRVITQREFYDFKPDQKTMGFGVSRCYQPEEKQEFEIKLEGPGSFDYDTDTSMKMDLSLAISKALGISFLRVEITSLSNGDSYSLISGALLERDDSLDLFAVQTHMQINNTVGENLIDYTKSTNTPSLCAKYCAIEKNRPFKASSYSYCYSFDFNKRTKTCSFSFAYEYEPTYLYNTQVDHYQRTYSDYYDSVSLEAAWATLQSKVNSGLFSFKDDKNNDIKAISVEEKDSYKPKIKDDPLRKFYSSNDALFRNPVEKLEGYTKGACADQCINNLKYNCVAFAYSDKSYKCSLYDDNELSYSSSKADTTSYIRVFSDGFMYISGFTMLSKSDAVYTNVYGIEECAKLCVKNTDFFCQSFESCGSVCLLGHQHYYDAPATASTTKKTDSSDCAHLSREYLSDYQQIPNKKALTGSHLQILENVGVRECAHLCSTSPSFTCDVFEYCSLTSTCRVSTKFVKNTKSLSYKDSGKCDIYQLKNGHHRFTNTISDQSQSSAQTASGHSPGSMGGIAIGMIFLGVIVILVVAYVGMTLRFRSMHGGGTTSSMGFSKRQLEEE